eukprot:Skav204730  [mRNA]  locus=scaffold1549:262768:263502:- [translate_table: standard]
MCFLREGIILEPILKAALLSGIVLTKKQLESIMECEDIPYPDRGSGVKGRILLADLAKAVVFYVLADLDEATRNNVLAKMTRQSSAGNKIDGDDLPVDLLKVVSNLDLENKEQFKELKEAAQKLLDEELENAREEEIKKRVQTAKKDWEMEIEAKLSKELQEKKSVSAKSASAKQTRASHDKNRAPPELLELLPPGISLCYVAVRFKSRVASAEFKRFLAIITLLLGCVLPALFSNKSDSLEDP